MHYDTSVLILCCLTLLILCILVYENNRMRENVKVTFYVSYILIGLAAISEWITTQISLSPSPSRWPLLIFHCLDCTLTPMVALAFVKQLQIQTKIKTALKYMLAGNAVLQIVSIFTGWMMTIGKDGEIAPGLLFPVYILFCFCLIGMDVYAILKYSLSYHKRNSGSLYAIAFLVFLGSTMQEFLGQENRTSFLALTIGAALLFIHFSEFFQLKSDDRINEQQIQITTDALTGLLSRHAYSRKLESSRLPTKDFVVFSIDINGLKTTNDTLGHDAGDELIRAAAQCIEKVLGVWGNCYRTGGDEFIVFANMNRAQAEHAIHDIEKEAWRWRGEKVKELSLSVGCVLAADYPDLEIEKLVIKSDQEMYKAKDAYYKKTGLERRRSP